MLVLSLRTVAATANPMATNMGLITVSALSDPPEPPGLEITWTIIKPETSSIIAVPLRTTPSRALANPVFEKTVNVAPILVEQRDAPAANACRRVADAILVSVNDSPMGTPTPVKATKLRAGTWSSIGKFMSIDHLGKDVSHFTIKSFIYSFSRGQKLTFVDKENQPQVFKLLDHFLDISTQPVCSVFLQGIQIKIDPVSLQ